MADDLVPGSVVALDMRFGKLPRPVLGSVLLRGVEHAELGLLAIFGCRKSQLNAHGLQDGVLGEHEQRPRCISLTAFLLVDALDVAQEPLMVVQHKQLLLRQRLVNVSD
jgi:hypothetical protein